MKESRTVLYVEDDGPSRRLFKEAAAESGVADVEYATSVADALDYFPKRAGGDSDEATVPPSLIVLDIDLTGSSGLALLEELKSSNTSLRRIPVLILSSDDSQETINRAYDLGASAYLVKPTDYGDLLALMEEFKEFWLTRVKSPTH